jgi:ferredoxin-NADP reductase
MVKKVPHGFASNYIFNNWKKGTELTASAPSGTFYYQKLRDSKNILGIFEEKSAKKGL